MKKTKKFAFLSLFSLLLAGCNSKVWILPWLFSNACKDNRNQKQAKDFILPVPFLFRSFSSLRLHPLVLIKVSKDQKRAKGDWNQSFLWLYQKRNILLLFLFFHSHRTSFLFFLFSSLLVHTEVNRKSTS